ncbi:MAG TPA: Nif3-like dinuclear metal center hexameric protein [Paludibacteraceae bacterium]|nr:Nif3-like dinuclear metal center hexameric protein [Paludibacteraceae bacterium]
MKIKELTAKFEEYAPLSYQESYDNCGMQVGTPEAEIRGVLLTLDITEGVIDEAIAKGCNLIIAHHPLIFRGVKKIIGRDHIERCIIKAIKNDVAIYASHTNMDKMKNGVSARLAQKIGLKDLEILVPEQNCLFKIVTFVPTASAAFVRQTLFEAGAGTIGKYDRCSYSINGEGTFRAGNDCHPFVGAIGGEHHEEEVRIETIIKKEHLSRAIKALLAVHPYEDPAYDIYELKNEHKEAGLGIIGNLPEETELLSYLKMVKEKLQVGAIRYTEPPKKKIKRVALCGGSGSEFVQNAIAKGADLYISGDFKYHDLFNAENIITIADVGHFESEQFTKEIFFEIVSKNNPKFAIQFSDYKTNPINYI